MRIIFTPMTAPISSSAAPLAFHTADGTAFVGLRQRPNGRRQVVYDEVSGKRVVLDLSGTAARDADILSALREGAQSRNALGGIIAALRARSVPIQD